MRFRYSTEENGKLVKKAAVYTQDEHRIKFSDVDSHAVQITEKLQANGYETYIVGGAVRDLILGKKPKDFDIVTAANPTKIKKIFRNARIIGRRFRLVHVFFGPKIIEVSTFRSLRDGPTSNTFGTVEEDVLRRDFSLNALFYDPIKQIVVDYVGGMKDIRNRLIRPIIALSNIFIDDPVRMIRAVKYAAAADFKLPLSLKMRIRRHSGLLADISPSRLTEEIFKIINSPHAREIVEGLDSLGLYCYLQPQAAELFKSRSGFRAKYLETMGSVDREAPVIRRGEIMSVLIRDYLEDTADWDGKQGMVSGQSSGAVQIHSPAERYKNTFILARKFVLPMNPPRVELEAALRLLFAEHGVTVKRLRHNEHPVHAASPANAARPAAAEPKPAEKENEGAPNKRRRRRRKRAEPSAPVI